jgi:hypothetical protein
VADPHSLRFTINETSIINIATENVKSYLETLELSRYMTSHRVLAGLLTQTLTEEQMAQIRAEYDGLRNKYVSNSPSPVLHPGSTLTGRPDPRQLVQRLDRALDREKIAESATRITEFISRVVILAPKAKL